MAVDKKANFIRIGIKPWTPPFPLSEDLQKFSWLPGNMEIRFFLSLSTTRINLLKSRWNTVELLRQKHSICLTEKGKCIPSVEIRWNWNSVPERQNFSVRNDLIFRLNDRGCCSDLSASPFSLCRTKDQSQKVSGSKELSRAAISGSLERYHSNSIRVFPELYWFP